MTVSSAREVTAREVVLGDLSLLVDGADLRYICWQGVELVRRIYVTVRDDNWDTPPANLRSRAHRASKDRFDLEVEATSTSALVALDWSARANATPHGTVAYEAAFRPRRAFPYCRIGLCVLFPPSALAGAGYVASADTGTTRGRFDTLIAPQLIRGDEILPLFPAFERLEINIPDLGVLELAITGDLLEMEDQRNWSDGSFKAYCTPLSVPRPHCAQPDKPIRQRLEITVTPQHKRCRPRRPTDVIEVDFGDPAGVLAPPIGVELYESDISPRAAVLLRAAGLEHLRVDLRRDPAGQLRTAAATAQQTSTPLAPAVYLSGEPDEAAQIATLLSQLDPAPIRIYAFPRDAAADDGTLAHRLRDALADRLPTVPIIGGTDIWFVDLNRCRPNPNLLDGVAWSVTPQVHLNDSQTAVEGLEAQRDQVETAAQFAPACPLVVGPITLRPRYNPNATDARQQALNRPRPSIDPRQTRLETAAWTVGSLASITSQMLAAATYFEAVGERGILSTAAEPYPVWYVLAEAAARTGMQVLPAVIDQPLRAAAFATEAPGSPTAALVANLTASPIHIRITGCTLPLLGAQMLDATAGWYDVGHVPSSDSGAEFDLHAHGVTRLILTTRDHQT